FFATTELGQSAVVFLLPLAVLVLIPPLVAMVRGAFNPLEPLYFCLLAYSFVYVAKPATRLIQGDGFAYGQANFEWAVCVSIIGLLAFYIGYFSPLGPWVASCVPPMRREVDQHRFCLCGWVFIFIGGAGLWTYMEHSGGWRTFLFRP